MNTLLRVVWNAVYNLTGFDVSFGARYFDWSFYLIELRADYERVRRLLASPRFAPVQSGPGETTLQIIGCDMRRVQFVGPYHEVSVQVPIESLHGQPGPSFAHLFLPVDSEAARWAGVDITGFPKFLAQIECRKGPHQVGWQLAEKSAPILSFSLNPQTGRQRPLQWHYYGLRERQVIRTTFDLSGKVAETAPDTNASLQLGSHPLAEKLRGVILSQRVERSMVGHPISGFLHKPVVVSPH